MHIPLIVGGAGGIGLALAHLLAERHEVERVYIVDRNEVPAAQQHPKFTTFRFDLETDDFDFFGRFTDIDALLITAGFGRLSPFRDLTEQHIISSFAVNTTAVVRLIHRFFPRIESRRPFHTMVMVSIAGFMSSPFFSVYGASKAALRIFIESVNVELEKAGTNNRILNVSPGSISGTGFAAAPAAQSEKAAGNPTKEVENSTSEINFSTSEPEKTTSEVVSPPSPAAPPPTDLEQVRPLATEILAHLEAGDDRFIPQWEEVFRHVLDRCHNDFRAEGRRSYDYKVASGRVKGIETTP